MSMHSSSDHHLQRTASHKNNQEAANAGETGFEYFSPLTDDQGLNLADFMNKPAHSSHGTSLTWSLGDSFSSSFTEDEDEEDAGAAGDFLHHHDEEQDAEICFVIDLNDGEESYGFVNDDWSISLRDADKDSAERNDKRMISRRGSNESFDSLTSYDSLAKSKCPRVSRRVLPTRRGFNESTVDRHHEEQNAAICFLIDLNDEEESIGFANDECSISLRDADKDSAERNEKKNKIPGDQRRTTRMSRQGSNESFDSLTSYDSLAKSNCPRV